MKMKMSTKEPDEYLSSGQMYQNIQTGFNSLRLDTSHIQGQHVAPKTRRCHTSNILSSSIGFN
jgi:hypothetical protein